MCIVITLWQTDEDLNVLTLVAVKDTNQMKTGEAAEIVYGCTF